MRFFKIIFTPRAMRQLDELYSYIASRSGEVRAENYIARIVADCDSLANFPARGTKRDDIRPGLRTMGFERRATIAFAVHEEDECVSILGIYYAGQDFENPLRDLSKL